MALKLTTLDQFTMLANRCKTEIGKVKDEIPTKVSELENDSEFMTEDDVLETVNAAGKLSRKVVESLASIDKTAPGAENFIYMVPVDANDQTKGYTEYMLIGNDFDIVGTTADINLEGYITEDDAATDEEVTAALNTVFQSWKHQPIFYS